MENQELEYRAWLSTQENPGAIVAANLNAKIADEVRQGMLDTNLISDGYHTFGELYEHRIQLFITLAKMYVEYSEHLSDIVWRSMLHSDGTSYEGWFILGIDIRQGCQITYHLPISKWGECSFAETLDKAPELDGHTSADILERLKSL